MSAQMPTPIRLAAEGFVLATTLFTWQGLVLRGLALILLALLGGCAGLPALEVRMDSRAVTDVAGTTLARTAQATLAGDTASALRLLPAGDQALDARLALIERAERSLDLQYYQIADDQAGSMLVRALRDAARRGVSVRLLVDDLYATGQDERLAALAAERGIEVRLFNPLPARQGGLAARVLLSLHEFGRINRRMHNKLFIADGSLAISGGRNIADEYFDHNEPAGFIDMDILSAGAAVAELRDVFDRYWNSRHAYRIEQFAQATATSRQALDQRLDALPPRSTPAERDALGQTSVSAQLDHGSLELHAGAVQVLADDPDKAALVDVPATESTVATAYMTLLDEAQSEVLLSSPYLVPSPRQLATIYQAAQRKVQVSVITNSLSTTDEPLVHSGYSRFRTTMLRMGIELYELMPLARRAQTSSHGSASLGRLHAKLAVVDGQRLFIGSMNVDRRSARVNTEMALVVASPVLAEQAARLLRRDRLPESYKLRLAADGERIEWVVGAGAAAVTLSSEPDVSVTQSLQQWLGELFVSEDLL